MYVYRECVYILFWHRLSCYVEGRTCIYLCSYVAVQGPSTSVVCWGWLGYGRCWRRLKIWKQQVDTSLWVTLLLSGCQLNDNKITKMEQKQRRRNFKRTSIQRRSLWMFGVSTGRIVLTNHLKYTLKAVRPQIKWFSEKHSNASICGLVGELSLIFSQWIPFKILMKLAFILL